MSPELLLSILGAALLGFLCASLLVPRFLSEPPERLMRNNVNGREVPAVLGGPLTIAAVVALTAVALATVLGWDPAPGVRPLAALALVLVVMAIAGARDDRGGDESSRGFKGHLGALARGRVTGGALKILAGAVAGIGAGVVLFPGDLGRLVATAILVAATANLLNLFDRAPGRAGKVALLLLLPLLALGHTGWAVAASGLAGALMACLPVDLAERAMLGDAGANPLGASIGLGLAMTLEGTALWVAVALVVGLNLASERWSFSRAIARTPWLDSLDRAGRK